jgi:flagellar biosynthetic protein FliR
VVIPQFEALTVILVRVSGIMAAIPLIGGRAVPAQVKVGLMLMIGLVLMPIVPMPAIPRDHLLLWAGLGAEFLVGLVLGLGVRLVFTGIELAGELMGGQMGVGVVQLFDPVSSRPIPLISNFYTVLASLVFVSMNAHFLVVQAVAGSFALVPPFGAGLSSALVDDVIRLTQGMFLTALRLAAPVMAVILLINLGMAILGRAVTQLNVFVLSFPVTIAGGFLVMGASLPFTLGVFGQEFARLEEIIAALLRMLGHG